ncbi:MAG: aminopeptidase P family protein [Nitrospinae bacterium]|nr:aminopeptidase P family protein [Nitrospinota bacterium]
MTLLVDDPARSAPFLAARREKLAALLPAAGIDALVVTHMVNVGYLSGFTGTAGIVVVTGKGCHFLTDFRYAEQAAAQAVGMNVVIYKEPLPELAALLASEGIVHAGFEGEHVSVAKADDLKKKVDAVRWKPVAGSVERLRLVKDPVEMEAIRTMAGTLARVWPTAVELLRPGAVEREIAVELEYRLMQEGADCRAFDFIVASGPRSAMPHGVASEKVIAKNELVILDWGALGKGYHTDNTRTIVLGDVGPELRGIVDLCLEANLAAIDAVRPGVTMKAIDDVARGIITKAGYGPQFGHGTGHGVGRDIHEKPTVSWRDETPAQIGMVFTIEPGIYLPGRGGVRIEDMVHVTERGCEVLTERVPK